MPSQLIKAFQSKFCPIGSSRGPNFQLLLRPGSELSQWGRFHQKTRLLTLPLGENLPPGGGGISQGDGTEEGPKGIDVLSPPFVLATAGVLVPYSVLLFLFPTCSWPLLAYSLRLRLRSWGGNPPHTPPLVVSIECGLNLVAYKLGWNH